MVGSAPGRPAGLAGSRGRRRGSGNKPALGPLSQGGIEEGGRGGVNRVMREEMVALLPRLRRFAFGLTGNMADGDDLLQSACLRALDRAEQWRPGTRLDSWMYRILQNLWIDQIRAGRRREIAIDEDMMAAIPGGDQAREMEAKLGLAAVRREVAKLPAEQRAVLLLVSIEGASYKDAAEILDIPIGTVMSRLSRARLTLGQALEGRDGAQSDKARARP
jgi:RNA polymerase sigma-70 factor (ECF subfamily)